MIRLYARIPLSLSVFEVSSASTNTSLQSLWEIFNSLVDRSLWQVAPDNLKRFLEFNDCLRLCFKLEVSFQHCTLHMTVHWVHIQQIWRPLVFGDEIWTIGSQPVLCAARHCVLHVGWRARRAVLLEDESGAQTAIALKERKFNDNF